MHRTIWLSILCLMVLDAACGDDGNDGNESGNTASMAIGDPSDLFSAYIHLMEVNCAPLVACETPGDEYECNEDFATIDECTTLSFPSKPGNIRQWLDSRAHKACESCMDGQEACCAEDLEDTPNPNSSVEECVAAKPISDGLVKIIDAELAIVWNAESCVNGCQFIWNLGEPCSSCCSTLHSEACVQAGQAFADCLETIPCEQNDFDTMYNVCYNEFIAWENCNNFNYCNKPLVP